MGARDKAAETVTIHGQKKRDRWRYTCPNGHREWCQTNGGLWCRSCSQQHGQEDPHWHALIDQRTGERIPWSRVRLVER